MVTNVRNEKRLHHFQYKKNVGLLFKHTHAFLNSQVKQTIVPIHPRVSIFIPFPHVM